MSIETHNHPYDRSEYIEAFEKYLGDEELFENIQKFFSYLFIDDPPDRPLG